MILQSLDAVYNWQQNPLHKFLNTVLKKYILLHFSKKLLILPS